LVTAFLAVPLIALLAVPAPAQFFPPGPADDVTTSLGNFKIYVLEPWRPMVTGCPGYNPITFKWTSPILFDANTIVGRSNPGTDADGPDAVGRAVGIAAPVVVKDGDFTIWPPGFEGPAGTAEVHTNVSSLNMTGFGPMAVRAGTAAPLRPVSPGEVESKTLGGNDFPAESFFDVYVEVDVPACGGGFPASTFFNATALLVADTLITGFPPHVIYTHQNSSAVAVFFLGGPYAGQQFGWLILAGHGMSYSQGEQGDFEDFMAQVEEMPIPGIPTLTPYGLIILLLLLVGAGLWIWRRRRTATA
jgi:hypothetical protein